MTAVDPLFSVPPETLIQHPARLWQHLPEQAVDFALTYSRAGGTDRYDELAFRYLAACPGGELIQLETLASRVVTKRREANLRLPARVAELTDQGPYLAHRPAAISSGDFRVEIRPDLAFAVARDGRSWILPLGTPGRTLLSAASPRDVWRYGATDGFKGCWLPLAELVHAGCFPRMQTVRDRLVTGIRPGHLAVFISHRWQTPGAPDPQGEQAAIVTRRMIGALCEAIRTAAQRGLHTSRLVMESVGGIPVGPAGSLLAEAIVVNVLREAFDDATLALAVEEAERLESALGDPDEDQDSAGLDFAALRSAVRAAPTIGPLLRRVHLWYDYSCMPQPPRDAAAEQLFRAMLANMDTVQACGPILVLFDDEIDYLGRAWCHREAALAAQLAHDGVSTAGKADRSGTAPLGTDLQRLVIDRQLIAWRGALETEVLGVQTAQECMRRLGLAVTVPADLLPLYETLLSRGAPLSGRFGPKSLVTGVFPLPYVGQGDVLAPRLDYRPMAPVRRQQNQPLHSGVARLVGSLDSWNWLAIMGTRAWRVPEDEQKSWRVLSDAPRGCHLMAVGTCEAEAVFVAAMATRRRRDIKAMFGMPARTMSWLSVDAAPVGHRPDGKLRSMAVEADCWILVGTAGALSAEPVNAVVDLLQDAGVPAFAVLVDLPTDNVFQVWPDRSPDEPQDVGERLRTRRFLLVRADGPLPQHEKGLFLMDFSRHLLQPKARRRD